MTGWPLAVLAVLWTSGRAAMFLAGWLPRFVPALLDLAFLPALAVACALPLLAARSQRNYGFIGLLLSLSAANGIAHWAALHADIVGVRRAHQVALDVIVLMIVVMTGRVVPMFTRNTTKLGWVRGEALLERGSTGAVLLLTISDIWPGGSLPSTVCAAFGSIFLLARMRFWGA